LKTSSINHSHESEDKNNNKGTEERKEDDQREDMGPQESILSRKTINLNESWREFKFDSEQRNLNQEERFIGNKIHTSKYTFYNFLPKNLFFQFCKLANLYFLVMLCMQVIPQISITAGQPTIALPLTFVIMVSMVKDIIEDTRRHISDNNENNRDVLCIPQPEQERDAKGEDSDIFKLLSWRRIKVGQVIKVLRDEFFPADIVLLNSSDSQGS